MFGHIPRVQHKYIYCRAAVNLADDENQAKSVCFPVSAIRGIGFFASDSLVIRYESPFQFAQANNNNNDGILVGISAGEHRAFIDAFSQELAFGDTDFIILKDSVTGEQFHPDIQSVGITSDIT